MSLRGLYLERLIFGILRYLILSYLQNILRAFPRQFQFLINRPPYLNSLIIYVLMLSMFFFLPRTFPLPVIIQCMTETVYRAFSLKWPAPMQIHWKKRNCLHKKIVQLPLGTPA